MNTKVKVNMTSLSFMITDKCNLKCSFCSKNALCNNNRYMDYNFIDETIRDALAWSNIEIINLTGGEAFLHPQLEKILSIIDKYGLKTRINTNGMFFNDKNIKLLDKFNVNLFTISLDSSNMEIHDKIRGVKGAFNNTVNGIKTAVEHGYKVFVKATISNENVDYILDLMKFVDSLGVYGFSFGRAIPVGRGKNLDYVNIDFIKKYFNMGRLTSEYSLTSNIQFLIDDPLRFMFDVRSRKLLNSNINIEKIWGGCSAGCKFLYITLDKEVLSCPVIMEPCGNLNNCSLKDIWYNSKQLSELRTRSNLKGKCQVCKNKYLCGGCRAYALATTGDLLGEDLFCIMEGSNEKNCLYSSSNN